jgi:midasin
MKNPPQPEREDKKKEKKKRERVDPNPYRSEGDANKEWKERLRVMDKLTEEEEEKKDEEKREEDDQMDLQDDEEDKEEAEMYEFMKEDDQDKEDAQTLAPADETQAKSIPQKDDDKKQKEDGLGDEEDEEEEEQKEKDKEEEEEDREKGEGDEEKEKERERVKEMRSLRMAKDQRRGKDGEEEDKPEDDVEDLTKDDDADDDNADQRDERREEGSHHSMPLVEEAGAAAKEEVELTLLSPEAIMAKREELDREMAEWREKGDMVHAEKLWRGYEALTAPLAQDLCEQLRLILEPTLCTQMRGDYRTGKRLNMKKVIPYIASQFKKDKIWMRRTKPSKRTYQVMLAIDDSRSMFENRAGHMACQALTLMAKALAQLEVGQLAILRFGDTSDVLHPFDTPFTDQSGVDIISHFAFKQENTDVVRLMESVVSAFDIERHSGGGGRDGDHMQILFVVSDGRFGTRGKDVKRWIREALKRNIFIVFIITDASRPNAINLATHPHPNAEVDPEEAEIQAKRAKRAAARGSAAAGGSAPPVRNDSSILELQTITINREGKPVRSSYMDTFPFPNYIVLQDINALPSILADALRQWFELIQQKFAQA